MHVAFDIPADWSARREGDRVLVQRSAFGTRLEATLVPKGVDPRTRIEANIGPEYRVQYVQLIEQLRTKHGWPMKLATLEIRRDGAWAATRIAAVYEMTQLLGIAVATLVSEEDRLPLIDILRTARPVLWPRQAVCIAELWSMEDA